MEIKRPYTKVEWLATPKAVQSYIEMLEQAITKLSTTVDKLTVRTEKLEDQTKRNSQNSNKPPSTDGPFQNPKKKKKKKKAKRKRGGQKGHKGHRQQLLEPTNTISIEPDTCFCGCHEIDNVKPYYTHQVIELPEIKLDVTHYVLHKGQCHQCGKRVNAEIDRENRFGYGPRMTALIGELSGMQGISRKAVQQFLDSVLGVPISTGAVQKVIDRISNAIKPAYNKVAQTALSRNVGYVDETSWFLAGKLQWLWVMVTDGVALYLVHPRRSREAFNELIQSWKGILVSDNYGVYQNWVNKRQNCLAHYIRKARGLAESKNVSHSHFGQQLLTQLQLLCHFAKAPPSKSKWTEFYSGFLLFLMLHEGADDETGKLARSLGSVLDSLWVFLEEHGVDPTNNRAERALRFGVIWRKRCFGSQSEKGERWIERILSLKETCRLKSKPSFPILVDLVQAYFKEQLPDLAWIT